MRTPFPRTVKAIASLNVTNFPSAGNIFCNSANVARMLRTCSDSNLLKSMVLRVALEEGNEGREAKNAAPSSSFALSLELRIINYCNTGYKHLSEPSIRGASIAGTLSSKSGITGTKTSPPSALVIAKPWSFWIENTWAVK